MAEDIKEAGTEADWERGGRSAQAAAAQRLPGGRQGAQQLERAAASLPLCGDRRCLTSIFGNAGRPSSGPIPRRSRNTVTNRALFFAVAARPDRPRDVAVAPQLAAPRHALHSKERGPPAQGGVEGVGGRLRVAAGDVGGRLEELRASLLPRNARPRPRTFHPSSSRATETEGTAPSFARSAAAAAAAADARRSRFRKGPPSRTRMQQRRDRAKARLAVTQRAREKQRDFKAEKWGDFWLSLRTSESCYWCSRSRRLSCSRSASQPLPPGLGCVTASPRVSPPTAIAISPASCGGCTRRRSSLWGLWICSSRSSDHRLGARRRRPALRGNLSSGAGIRTSRTTSPCGSPLGVALLAFFSARLEAVQQAPPLLNFRRIIRLSNDDLHGAQRTSLLIASLEAEAVWLPLAGQKVTPRMLVKAISLMVTVFIFLTPLIQEDKRGRGAWSEFTAARHVRPRDHFRQIVTCSRSPLLSGYAAQNVAPPPPRRPRVRRLGRGEPAAPHHAAVHRRGHPRLRPERHAAWATRYGVGAAARCASPATACATSAMASRARLDGDRQRRDGRRRRRGRAHRRDAALPASRCTCSAPPCARRPTPCRCSATRPSGGGGHAGPRARRGRGRRVWCAACARSAPTTTSTSGSPPRARATPRATAAPRAAAVEAAAPAAAAAPRLNASEVAAAAAAASKTQAAVRGPLLARAARGLLEWRDGGGELNQAPHALLALGAVAAVAPRVGRRAAPRPPPRRALPQGRRGGAARPHPRARGRGGAARDCALGRRPRHRRARPLAQRAARVGVARDRRPEGRRRAPRVVPRVASPSSAIKICRRRSRVSSSSPSSSGRRRRASPAPPPPPSLFVAAGGRAAAAAGCGDALRRRLV